MSKQGLGHVLTFRQKLEWQRARKAASMIPSGHHANAGHLMECHPCCKSHCTSSSESCKLDLSCTTSLTASVSNLRSRSRYHKYLRKISAALKPVFILRLLVTPALQDHLALNSTPERPWWCNILVNGCPQQGSAAVCSCTASGAQLSIGAVDR